MSSGCVNVPRHVAVIMDGNGRWARRRGLPRAAGHRAGIKAVRRCIATAIREGTEWLTLFAFSSENWRRPEGEVMQLTGLLRHYLRSELATLAREGICLRIIGEKTRFPPDIREELDRAERQTANNQRLNLTIALSYGGRNDIMTAAKAIARSAQRGLLQVDSLEESDLTSFLSTAMMPELDLLIRTGGEHRLSNFLLWQCAYAELVFLDVLWPDFGANDLVLALIEFKRRQRRYGTIVV